GRGTMLEGLRKPRDLIVIVVTLLTYGCPVQAIVHAFGLDERTVADWRDRAGAHCHQVHQEIVEQGRLDLMHVQADEIRVKGCKMIAWMCKRQEHSEPRAIGKTEPPSFQFICQDCPSCFCKLCRKRK